MRRRAAHAWAALLCAAGLLVGSDFAARRRDFRRARPGRGLAAPGRSFLAPQARSAATPSLSPSSRGGQRRPQRSRGAPPLAAPVLTGASTAHAAARATAGALGVALAASGGTKRRRRKDELPPTEIVKGKKSSLARKRRQPEPEPEEPAVGGMLDLPDIAEVAATSLAVTDQDLRRRKIKRQSAMKKWKAYRDEDPIRNLIELGEDPDFFGAPFVWFQLSHLIILVTAVLAAVLGGSVDGTEFALFDLEGPALEALRNCLYIAAFVNIVIAIVLFKEEFDDEGPDKLLDAVGWLLKGVVLGGVAYWQRSGRINRRAVRKATGWVRPQDLSEA